MTGMQLRHAKRRRTVVIMFADIVSSTATISTLDPEDAHALLQHGLAPIQSAIEAQGGMVIRVQGDGVLALFGVDEWRGDEASRACLAGTRISERFAQAARAAHGLQVRVGIHVGHILLEERRNAFGREIDATGAPVHVASKIEAMCRPNGVAVSRDVADMAVNSVSAIPIGHVSVGDGTTLVDVLEITAAVATPGPAIDDNPAHGPIVGRTAELARGQAWLAAQTSGAPCLLIVEGEAGIGKSAYCSALIDQARSEAMLVCRLDGLVFQKLDSFRLVQDLVSRLLGCVGETDADAVRHRCDALGLAEGDAEVLLRVLQLVDDADWSSPFKAKTRIRKSAQALLALLEAYAPGRRHLFVLEDVHWFDAASLDVIIAVLNQTDPARFKAVATSRPPLNPDLHALDFEVMKLPRLAFSDAKTLIQALAASRGNAFDEALTTELAARTGGLPFFIVAYCMSRSLDREASISQIPVTIEASIQEQLDQLDGDERTLMDLLSLSSGGIEVELLGRALHDDQRAQDISATILARGLARRGPDGRLEPAHKLLAEACENQILKSTRLVYHRQLLDLLAQGDNPTRNASRLAYHAEKAEAWDEALRYLWKSCTREVKRASLSAITTLHARALRVCDMLGRDADLQRARFNLLTFDTFFQRGQLDGLEDRLIVAVEVARAHGDAMLEAQALAHLGILNWMTAHHRDALDYGQRAEALASDAEIIPLVVYAQLIQAVASHGCGDVHAAITRMNALISYLDNGLSRMPSGTIGMPSILSRALQIWYLAQAGQFDAARAVEPTGYALAEEALQTYALINMRCGSGLLSQTLGAYEKALEHYQLSLDTCYAEELLAMAPRALAGVGQVLVRMGRSPEAYALLRDGLEAGIQFKGGRVNWVYLHAGLAEASCAIGNGEAENWAEMAIGYGEDNGEPTSVMVAQLTLGDVLLNSGGDADRARAAYRRALDTARALDLKPAAAFARAGLALLKARTGTDPTCTDDDTDSDAIAALFEDLQLTTARDRFLAALDAQHPQSAPAWHHDAV